MMNKRIILRGRGPAPTGYSTCFDPKCTAQRDFCSGRFQRIPNHYHPSRGMESIESWESRVEDAIAAEEDAIEACETGRCRGMKARS